MNQIKLADITAIVLAGGKSTRMGGSDKSMLPVKGLPMIQHIISQLMDQFREIIISGDPEKYGKLGHRVIPDEIKGKGPLMGVYTCLAASSTELNFVTACDIPDISTEFIQNMLWQSDGFDIVMPVNKNNYYEPLHAVYRKTVLPSAAKLLEEGKLKLSDLSSLVRTRFVRMEGSENFPNINYMEDYQEYKGGKS
jgi:molybdopterin-guanine dinucleotide biosynthesis protein A